MTEVLMHSKSDEPYEIDEEEGPIYGNLENI